MKIFVSCPLLGLILALVGCAVVSTPNVLPMDQPASLDPGQGFLLIEVDSNCVIHRLAIQPADASRSHCFLENLPKGRTTRLVRMPAGEYQWVRVEIMGYSYRNRKYPYIWEINSTEDRWRFEVVDGKVNHPGVLVLSRKDAWLTHFTPPKGATYPRRTLLSERLASRVRKAPLETPSSLSSASQPTV